MSAHDSRLPGDGGANSGDDVSSAHHPAVDASSATGLLRQLAHEVPTLLAAELALLKAEAQSALRTTQAGVGAVATGGAVMLAGLLFVLLAAVYALSTVVAPWLAALIVGVVALLVGWGMVKAGKHKFDADALRPDRTIDNLNKDKDALRGRNP